MGKKKTVFQRTENNTVGKRPPRRHRSRWEDFKDLGTVEFGARWKTDREYMLGELVSVAVTPTPQLCKTRCRHFSEKINLYLHSIR